MIATNIQEAVIISSTDIHQGEDKVHDANPRTPSQIKINGVKYANYSIGDHVYDDIDETLRKAVDSDNEGAGEGGEGGGEEEKPARRKRRKKGAKGGEDGEEG